MILLRTLPRVQTQSKLLLEMAQARPAGMVRTQTTFEVIKTISQSDVQQFAALTGDTNPIHTTGSLDQGAVVHGALLMGYVAGTIGANCPGAIVASQQMKFATPCPVGTTVKVKIEFVEHRKITECNFACADLTNEEVIYMFGSAKLRIGSSKSRAFTMPEAPGHSG